jgi:hypothetical protein
MYPSSVENVIDQSRDPNFIDGFPHAQPRNGRAQRFRIGRGSSGFQFQPDSQWVLSFGGAEP